MKISFENKKIDEIKEWLGSGSINIFGMPFSGKDTQCHRLAKLLNANTFGGGDILRNTKTSEKLKTDIDNGFFAPTDEYIKKIVPYFSKPEFEGKPLILSSVGRWDGEEKSVIEAAKKCNHQIKVAIFLNLEHSESIRRNKVANRGRVDDHHSLLNNRFSEFENKTFPVIEKYKALGLLVEIDGNQTENHVTESILSAIYIKVKGK